LANAASPWETFPSGGCTAVSISSDSIDFIARILLLRLLLPMVGYAYVCHGSVNRYWLRSIVGVVLTDSDIVHGDRFVVCLVVGRQIQWLGSIPLGRHKSDSLSIGVLESASP